MSKIELRIAPAEKIPLWVNAVVILCAVLTGMGAVIAFFQPGMLLQPHAQITGAVRTYAGYLTARNLALAAMLLVLMIAGLRRALGNLLAIVGLIQIVDSIINCLEARWTIAPGVLLLGVVFLFAATRLCGQLWRRDAWI